MRAHFAKLPPDLQRVIADRENERDATFNRQVNEAAEKRRAAEAELQADSTERRQYLASLSAVIGELAKQTAGEFADIRSTADLERLANDDPARYLRWQARRDALLAAQAEADALQERERTEMEGRGREYLAEQRKLLLESSEVADPSGEGVSAESTAISGISASRSRDQTGRGSSDDARGPRRARASQTRRPPGRRPARR
jgi:uncharacterized protein YnzC (UPF0291/DUF896 family)